MDITYLGHSSFKLKGKHAVVVTDPYDSNSVGLKFPKHTTADILTVSHAHGDHNAVGDVEGNPHVINGPGEYEIKGVGVIGFGTYHDEEKGAKRGKNTIYRIDIDGLNIVHLGDLGHTLSSELVDSLGEVDVLLLPVGGFYTIDAETASQVLTEIEPSICIPMHYNRPELNQKIFKDVTGVDSFLKLVGKADAPRLAKLTVTKDKLPEQLQVVVLE